MAGIRVLTPEASCMRVETRHHLLLLLVSKQNATRLLKASAGHAPSSIPPTVAFQDPNSRWVKFSPPTMDLTQLGLPFLNTADLVA